MTQTATSSPSDKELRTRNDHNSDGGPQPSLLIVDAMGTAL